MKSINMSKKSRRDDVRRHICTVISTIFVWDLNHEPRIFGIDDMYISDAQWAIFGIIKRMRHENYKHEK